MNTHENFMPFENRLDLSELESNIQKVRSEIRKVIVGQERVIDLLITSLLSNGHVLLEGVPGVAKTIIAKLLAKTIRSDFQRIQFTPDLMPSDVIGTSIFDMKSNEFTFKKGPIFANLVLIDEINRAPAKTQAALFECMAERQVTADGTTYPLEPPFLVIATQNPVEQEGTYRLPEAQLDRFLFKVNIYYPNLEEEIRIIQEHHERKNIKKEDLVEPVVTDKQIIAFQELVMKVFVHPQLIDYVAKLVMATRNHPFLSLGASPRASLAILDASKAWAAINGRDFVIPEDIKMVSFPVLGHRIQVTPEREMEGFHAEKVVETIIDSIEIPR